MSYAMAGGLAAPSRRDVYHTFFHIGVSSKVVSVFAAVCLLVAVCIPLCVTAPVSFEPAGMGTAREVLLALVVAASFESWLDAMLSICYLSGHVKLKDVLPMCLS